MVHTVSLLFGGIIGFDVHDNVGRLLKYLDETGLSTNTGAELNRHQEGVKW